MEQIERELRQFVVDNFLFGEGESQFSNGDSFLEKGLVDSMGILNLVDFAQQKFGITVADAELVPENWDSVRQIALFVHGKLSVAK